jgi:hypothetical protein
MSIINRVLRIEIAWSFTIAARVLRLELPKYTSILLMGFIGAALLHRSVLRLLLSTAIIDFDL